jgi:hypothetical protein
VLNAQEPRAPALPDHPAEGREHAVAIDGKGGVTSAVGGLLEVDYVGRQVGAGLVRVVERSFGARIARVSSQSRSPGQDQISLPRSDFVPKSLPLNSAQLRPTEMRPLTRTSGTRFRSPRATSYTESLPANSRTVNPRVQSQRLIDMLEVGVSIPSPPTRQSLTVVHC